MHIDLLQIPTRDGVRLDGMLSEPAAAGGSLPIDVALCIHGTGGNFYSSTLFDSLANRLLERGVAVLRINTRGHDGISTAATAQGGRRLGAAYETVSDCLHDLTAWLDLLFARGLRRVALIGHSLGAVKALYLLAHEAHDSAARCVALSPPRLSYSVFEASPQREEFLATFAAAEANVREGRAAALLDVQFPLPYVVSAAGYMEKYGPDERYDVMRLVPRVGVPLLVTFGSIEIETNVAFRGVPEALAGLGRAEELQRVEIIPRGDHFYSAVRDELATRVIGWLTHGTRE